MKKEKLISFNPCFIGTYSFTVQLYFNLVSTFEVLILVLLELILLQAKAKAMDYSKNLF